jgi:hypothetical protein
MRLRRLAALTVASWTIASSAGAGDAPRKRYFYKGYDYGSQSLFNPMHVLLNRGFDTLQLRQDHNIFHYPYLIDARNVAENVVNPTYSLDAHGWGRWATTELLPQGWTTERARWLPNYGLHLLGGGVTFAALREWYEDHGAPVPGVFSAVTVYAAAFINEMFENRLTVGPNADAISDLLVFDAIAVIAFSFDSVQEFFSKRVIVSDWSLQPAFTIPSGGLHNVGNYYSVKIPVPYYERLRMFGYMGQASMVGLSYQLDGHYSLSAAGGVRIERVENALYPGDVVVSLRPAGALFLDRDESLLASIHVADIRDYLVHMNLYPNAFLHTNPGIGAWTALGREGHWLVGLSFTRSIGFGVGAGTL